MKRGTALIVYIMVFMSGFAGLVYQVLWMKQLGFLFGNTSQAAAATLSAFFVGLAAGSWFWGRRSQSASNPMRLYAWLEIGIGVTALLYFAVLKLFNAAYPAVYQHVNAVQLLLAVKFLLALFLVFPPSFFMGGTIPVIGEAVIKRREDFGLRAARLYGANTLGAAIGAFTAAFFMVRFLGFTLTCAAAMTVTATVAACAGLLAMRKGPGRGDVCEKEKPEQKEARKQGANHTSAGSSAGRRITEGTGQGVPRSKLPVYTVCFLSGFCVLALEVLWTRLFAQVHTNSVYCFSLVLVAVLVGLALGALAASRLARLKIDPMSTLSVLLGLAGMSVAVSPFVFMTITSGFQILDTSGSFAEYMWALFGKGAVVIGIPAFFLGIIFPFLMKTEERFEFRPGSSLGRLSAVNTAGAVLGSLLCGFVMLGWFGMWRTMQVIAGLYFAAGILVSVGFGWSGLALRSAGIAVLLAVIIGLNPAGLRATGWDPARLQERQLDLWETSDCTVSVVLIEADDYVIKINSNYSLGSTAAAWRQHFQGRIPLLVYPGTRSIFFLGMGTGMSAGGALDPRFKSVERVVVCELVPEVVQASKKYMTGRFCAEGDRPIDYTSGLFDDRRVEIVIDDGRHYLMAGNQTFDMINADLFLPYRSGEGSLYSLEHFRNVKARLNPGGVFVQWLPMFQLTEVEFGTIARTMLEVFGQVTMWRNNFLPGQEVVALVGHRNSSPVPGFTADPKGLRHRKVAGPEPAEIERLDLDFKDLDFNEETVPVFYCGNISASRKLFAMHPVSTDDKPVVEYSSPFSIRKRVDGFAPTLVGPRFVKLVDSLLAACPPESDPMLANRTAGNLRLVRAGAELHRFCLAKAVGDSNTATTAWALFAQEWNENDRGK